ncbi:hypothetical protein [Pseudomonas sp. Q2-TVG4-2]|uniref:hypothetical protein n=1 Tax=Pseudomonas sp. Q2-TVG4-2 TaxID=1685699 RepID=UPI0015E77BED|nr:hypothetical protein [Pseudomonas sp. Q2-TVG4-2]
MQTATIADLRRELEELRPLSEAEIAQQVRAGADAAELLNKQDEIDRRRKAVALTLDAAEHRESEAHKTEARKEAAKLIAGMERHRRLAAYALSDCEAAVTALEAAVALFDEEARKAGLLAAKANQISLLSEMRERFSEAGRLWGRAFAVCLNERATAFEIRASEVKCERRFLEVLNRQAGPNGAQRQ